AAAATVAAAAIMSFAKKLPSEIGVRRLRVQPDAEERLRKCGLGNLCDQLAVVEEPRADARNVDAGDPVAVGDVGKDQLHRAPPARKLVGSTVAEAGDFIDGAFGDQHAL